MHDVTQEMTQYFRVHVNPDVATPALISRNSRIRGADGRDVWMTDYYDRTSNATTGEVTANNSLLYSEPGSPSRVWAITSERTPVGHSDL